MSNYEEDPMMRYERLLEQHYDDLTDDWDMYESTTSLRRWFDAGKTPEQVFAINHGPVVLPLIDKPITGEI